VAANKLRIPDELRGKIPGGLWYMVQIRWLVNFTFFVLSCFLLRGFNNRNGWIYFLGAILSPILLALYLIVVPLNPYHTPAAKFSGMTNLDHRDPVARQLVNLMRSAAARRFLSRTAVMLAGLFLLSMSVVVALQRQPLIWSLSGESAAWFPLLILLSAVGTLPIYTVELLLWSFRNWG
jgi:hypothetical protein